MKRNSVFTLLISCLVFFHLPIFSEAQNGPNLRFSNIAPKDGLSHHEVLFVFQDSQGFMWFGTKHGLNKYDGMQITPFFNEPENPSSLGGNFVHWIQEDQAGNLWFATWGDGISRYDPRTGLFHNYYHEENNPRSLGSDFVWSLYIDSKGFVWVTTDNGLGKLDPATGLCVNYHHDPLNPNSLSHTTISRIAEDDQGLFWISTYGGGLVRFDANTETFTRYQHIQDNPNSLSNDNLWGVFIDSHNRIWIASEEGLNSFDRETERFSVYQHDETDPNSLSSNMVTFINEDQAGQLWLGTFGGGLNRFDPDRKTFSHHKSEPNDPNSLSNDIVMSIVEDTGGAIWVATYGGVNKWDPGENQFNLFRGDPGNPNDLNGDKVRSLYQDSDGALWAGTDGGLNFAADVRNGFVHHVHDDNDPTSISGSDIWAIDQDKRGDLWVGTHGAGLNKFNPAQDVFVHYMHDPHDPSTISDNVIYDLVVDHDRDVLWIAAYNSGLDRFDIPEQTFTHYPYDPNDPSGIVSNWVTTVFVDQQGHLWIGTENGLSRFDAEAEVFTNFKHYRNDPSSLSDNMINAVFQDSRGIVWVGASNGLNRYLDTTQGFELFNQDDGLAGNRVTAITEDNDGLLWISTDKGLSRFDLQTGTVRNYDHRDGLQGDVFLMHSVYKNKAGDLFFGGINGFNIVRPDQLIDNQHIPPVVLTDFRLFNKSVQVGPESPLDRHVNHCRRITLKHDQSVFSIEFVGLNFTNTRKNQYAYMLEGFDREFIQTDGDNRVATYMNLTPGVYTFHAKASNNDGVWNEDGASLEINIEPPWWDSWWFTSILVGLACLIALAIIIYARKLTSEVSKRRQNEKDLRRSQERFKSLFEQAGDYILVLEVAEDGNLVIADANLAACKVHGYAHEELLGSSIGILDRNLDPELVHSLVKRVQSGQTILFETAHTKKDGTVFPVEVSAKYLETGFDQKLIISIERDISERKKSEEKIKQQQYYLERAQELGHIGTWELDLKKNTLHWTDENCRIFGVPLGSVVNYEVFIDKVHPDDREYVNREWMAAVAGKPYDIEHRLLIEGETTWVREKADVEFDENGKAINAIGFTQDITKRKLAEEEHKTLQAQLTQAQKMESIGRLAGGLAHDFNNMLNVIQGNTELALFSLPEGSPLLKHLNEIQKSVNRSANLTGQLLAYARQQAIVPIVLDLNVTIASMLQMLERLIGEDLDLTWKPGEDLDSVRIDPGQVDQLLTNLMVNARDAIGHDIGKVVIETGGVTFDEVYCADHPGFTPGNFVALKVSDDGCGMDKETQANIFEPFFTTKDIGKGTGLGLATLYGIVKQNNGFINVYSEKDIGTTFSIYLPALKGVRATAPTGKDVAKPASPGNETVLVVEDEPAILEMTQTVLERLGYTVLPAATPGQALRRAQEYNDEIHLLITDVVMPEMNGRDLASNLLTYYPDVLALFMSGYTADVIAHQGVLDEGVHFIQKPFSIQDLAEKVREVLLDRRSG